MNTIRIMTTSPCAEAISSNSTEGDEDLLDCLGQRGARRFKWRPNSCT